MSTTVTLNIPLDGDELEAAAETLTVMAEHYHRLEEQGDVQLEIDAQSTTTGGFVEVDANGIPWDERIHARTKSKAANGTWRKKRGVPDEIIAAVEAEITTVTPPAVVETPVAPAPAVVETPAAPAPAVVETPAAPAPAVVETPAAPAPAVVETPAAPAPAVVEITIMKQLVDRIKAEGIDPPTVVVACQTVGVVSLPTLGAKPDLIPQVAAALGFV